MPIGLYAKKLGMTQIFDETGVACPVTLLQAENSQISQIKTIETNGYDAIQLAYGEKTTTKFSKPVLGHLNKSGIKNYRYFSEFRVSSPENFNLGQKITLDIFEVGQKIKVTGTSIGKGFSGNQKRHNFSRGPMTHGSKNHRLPGSIGAGSTPGRVYPGKKMAGQLGNNSTSKNSVILFCDPEEKIIVVKGSVPGKKNNLLRIQTQS